MYHVEYLFSISKPKLRGPLGTSRDKLPPDPVILPNGLGRVRGRQSNYARPLIKVELQNSYFGILPLTFPASVP